LHFSYPSKTALAVYLEMGADFGSFADLFALYLKSILFPTNTLTADGTTSCISGYHFIRIFLLFFLHS
jgi:hypothetical protein